MSYHPSHAGTHHANFLTAGMPINYAHNHNATASPNTNASLLASNISSHSFPMAPSPNNGTPQPQQQQQQQQTQIQQQAQVQQQQQQQQQQATVAVAQQQQQQQPGTSVPPGVPDQEGLIAPPSMPLELDFDNLESASNYMHTYALSQGFDIRIQWSANNQTRICWSCYRGGFPETLNADGTPNTKKRQIPKEKERRKRGSLKIGCPFRVQCTKNWKTGKMELRILEGRHKHQMETDRENLPSQVRRIKSQRKGQDSPGTPQTGNAAANAVAQAANLTSTPTPAPSSSASGSQAGAKGRANAASKNGNANRIGTANASQAQRNQSQQQQAQQQQQADRSSSAPQNLLVNAAGPSAHQQLSLLGTPTPSNGAATAFDLDTDDVISDPVSSAQQVVDFQRRMLAILGLYDRSDSASRAIMDRELESMTSGAEARLNKPGRNKRKMGPNGNVLDPATSGLAALGAGTPTSNGSIAALARTAWNGNVNANAAATGTPRANPVNGIGSPLRTTAGSVGVSVPQTPLAQLASQQQTAPPSSGKGSARCSNCKEYGHNRRRCPLG